MTSSIAASSALKRASELGEVAKLNLDEDEDPQIKLCWIEISRFWVWRS
jgi:hypothetical protein